jgi:hypothetical protein
MKKQKPVNYKNARCIDDIRHCARKMLGQQKKKLHEDSHYLSMILTRNQSLSLKPATRGASAIIGKARPIMRGSWTNCTTLFYIQPCQVLQ